MNRMATVLTELSQSDVCIAGAGPTDQWTCNTLHVATNLLGFSSSLPAAPTNADPPNHPCRSAQASAQQASIDGCLRATGSRISAARTFGKRVVIGFAGFRGRFAVWLCRCKCGRLNVVEGARLTLGVAGSCGCSKFLSPAAKELRPILNSLIARCHVPANPMYGRYGAQGITVCKRWRESPEAFAADMGPRPSPRHIVACRNGAGNYTPANCYWALPAGVGGKNGHLITYKGKTQNLSQWAKQLSISRERMRQRVNKCLEHGVAPFIGDLEAKQTGKATKEQAADNSPAKVRPLTTQCLYGDRACVWSRHVFNRYRVRGRNYSAPLDLGFFAIIGLSAYLVPGHSYDRRHADLVANRIGRPQCRRAAIAAGL